MRPLFNTNDGNWTSPTVSGGSAGLNSAMWFACPECGASVVDMHHDGKNRIRHQEWHDNQEVNQ